MAAPGTTRDAESLRRHYLIERELADRLRHAGQGERKGLYGAVYNELFARVADHPQNMWKATPAIQEARTREQLILLRPYLRPDSVFLEIGAGECHLTLAVAAQVRQAYGLDVSDAISASIPRPVNFELIISDGVSVPVPEKSVDLAYSNSLIEHLHPDDAAEQLRGIYRALAPGGIYLCRTVHRFAGPQDISRYFDDEATGLHLKEYTYRELRDLFRRVGFTSTAPRVGLKGVYCQPPESLVLLGERLLGLLPHRARRPLTQVRLWRSQFDRLVILGRKGGA